MKRQSAIEVAQEILSKAEDGEDPWLISYADLVTNLLAFMVLLVSLAGISLDSMEAIPQVFSDSKQPAPLETLSADITKLAQEEGLEGKVATAVDSEGLAIRLQDKILFPSGVAAISDSGLSLVQKVARLLTQLPSKYRVAVEGHTDNVPIQTPRFASNWELSAARALQVRQVLAKGGVPEDRLSIIAYADTRPPEGLNDKLSADEKRRRSRRVVIRVHY